ncbi:hypothetical protein M5K25_005840 [Dendrobium thyrsiflorum]|uniref:Uncharacterized protein n=1 Tax=Dendrobium thyrsiflorum TaxID=117978 RepID=A0ABD0VA74_DENTH
MYAHRYTKGAGTIYTRMGPDERIMDIYVTSRDAARKIINYLKRNSSALRNSLPRWTKLKRTSAHKELMPGRGTCPLTGGFAAKWHRRINGYDSGPSEPGGLPPNGTTKLRSWPEPVLSRVRGMFWRKRLEEEDEVEGEEEEEERERKWEGMVGNLKGGRKKKKNGEKEGEGRKKKKNGGRRMEEEEEEGRGRSFTLSLEGGGKLLAGLGVAREGEPKDNGEAHKRMVGEWMMDPIKIPWFRRPGSSWSLVYLVRGGSRPNLTEGSLSAAMGCVVQGYLIDLG